MDKKKLRHNIIKQMVNRHIKPSNNLYKKLFQSNFFQSAKVIGVTLSMPNEIDTKPIIKYAKKMNKIIVVPRVLANSKMEFVHLNEYTKFKHNAYNILEPINGKVFLPKEINLMIVPGVYFSTFDHYRIGFGHGYYDRYLNNYYGVTVSLAFDFQTTKYSTWNINQYDQKIDYLIIDTDYLKLNS